MEASHAELADIRRLAQRAMANIPTWEEAARRRYEMAYARRERRHSLERDSTDRWYNGGEERDRYDKDMRERYPVDRKERDFDSRQDVNNDDRREFDRSPVRVVSVQ